MLFVEHVVNNALYVLLIIAVFEVSFLLLIVFPPLLEELDVVLTFDPLFLLLGDCLCPSFASDFQKLGNLSDLELDRATVLDDIVYFVFWLLCGLEFCLTDGLYQLVQALEELVLLVLQVIALLLEP